MINGCGQHDWRPTRAEHFAPTIVTCTRCEWYRQQIGELTKAHDMDAESWRRTHDELQEQYQRVLQQREFDKGVIAQFKTDIAKLADENRVLVLRLDGLEKL